MVNQGFEYQNAPASHLGADPEVQQIIFIKEPPQNSYHLLLPLQNISCSHLIPSIAY
jgi:hypothetical protein